jgi:hypothetical protein
MQLPDGNYDMTKTIYHMLAVKCRYRPVRFGTYAGTEEKNQNSKYCPNNEMDVCSDRVIVRQACTIVIGD